MTLDPANRYLVVTVKTRRELDAALDEAVNLLKPAATTEQVGVEEERVE
jgi:hypothetical protein